MMLSKLNFNPEQREKRVEENSPSSSVRNRDHVRAKASIPPEPEASDTFYCRKCDLGFMLEENYAIHLSGNMHNYRSFYKCRECGAKFTKEKQFRSHEVSMHKDEAFERKFMLLRCTQCCEDAIEVALAALGFNSCTTRQHKIELRRKHRQLRQRLINGPSSSSSSSIPDEPCTLFREGRGKSAEAQPKSTTNRCVTTARAIPGTSSQGQTGLNKEKIEKPTSISNQLQMKKESATDSSASSYPEYYSQNTSPKSMPTIKKYLLEKVINPSQQSHFWYFEQPTGGLRKSHSF